MQEETTRADVQVDPTAVDTQPEVQTQSPDTTQIGHDDAQTESQQQGSEAQPPVAKGISDADLAARREEGKLKKTQQELETYKQQLETYKQYILKSPERVKEALKEVDGYDDVTADQYVQQLRQKNPQLWAQKQQEVIQAAQNAGYSLTPDTSKQLVAQGIEEGRQREKQELEQQKFVAKFIEVLPDLDPNKYPDEDSLAGARDLAYRVAHLADNYRNFRPAMSLEESLTEAYKFITGKTDDQIKEAREQGRIEGMLARNNDNASNISPVAAGSGQLKKAVHLSEAEKAAAQRFGLTDEEYAEYSQPDSGRVK